MERNLAVGPILVAMALFAGCAAPLVGFERVFVVTVFLESDTSTDREYTISVFEDGALVESREATSLADLPFRSMVMSPSVEGQRTTVGVEAASQVLVHGPVDPRSCPTGEIVVTIFASDAGATMKVACN